MGNLSKSLTELDAMADELLKKSEAVEPVEDEDKDLTKSQATDDDNEELKPEDVSENTPEDTVQNTDDSEEKKDDTEEETDNDETEPEEDKTEKSVKKSIKKSVTPDDDDEDEDIEKCDDKVAPIKKSEKDESEEDTDEIKENLEKSIKKNFEDNEDIKKSMDASEFLTAMTEVLAKSLTDVVFTNQISAQRSSDNDDVLAKSLHASLSLNKSMAAELTAVKKQNETLKKSITEGFDRIQEQLEQFSHQPASMRKSVGNIQVQDRNFQKSLSGGQAGMNLSKSEVLAKLNNMMYSGNPLVTPQDIISYESGAPLRPEVAQLIQG
mgnify:CR=1 FL=1